MRSLLRYFVFTAAILGLAYASVTVQVDGRSVAAHLRDHGKVWLAALMEAAKPDPEPAEKKAAPKKAKPAPKKAVAKKKDERPVREVPPAELQSEPEAEKRVNLLANAAKQANTRLRAESKPEPTRITPEQKKALDALLTNRQSP